MVQSYDPEPVWHKPVDVPEKWIQHVDNNVLTSQFNSSDIQLQLLVIWILTSVELPQGSQVKGIYPYGASYWTRTAEIRTEQADKTEFSYFLKVPRSF